MTIQEIEKAIQNKNWKIEQISECECYIDWNIEKGENYGGYRDSDRIVAEIDTDTCYKGNVLYINNKNVVYCDNINGIIIERDAKLSFDKLIEIFDKYSIDIYEEIKYNISDEIPEHIAKLKRTLIDFLNIYVKNGYKMYISYPRNFANEYTLTLTNEILDDKELTTEEFADYYLTAYNNKDYYMGFYLIEKGE